MKKIIVECSCDFDFDSVPYEPDTVIYCSICEQTIELEEKDDGKKAS